MSKVEVGRKYWMRRFPSLGLDDMCTVKVVNLFKLGDGTEIVKYRIGLFQTEYMKLSKFRRHIHQLKGA